MSNFDFENSKLPTLAPLENSFEYDEVEKELKQLFCDLFKDYIATDLFDINVSGARHLGTYDLVRRAINSDGLVLLTESQAEAASRYLYRAWMGADRQGRGLHFLNTYFQVFYPGEVFASQLWHLKEANYPDGIVSTRDGPNVEIDPAIHWLTSRIEISVDLGLLNRSISDYMSSIRALMPARLVPHFRFCILIEVDYTFTADWRLRMKQWNDARFEWCGLVITDRPARMWQLGKEGDPYAPKLKYCRVEFEFECTQYQEYDFLYPKVYIIRDPTVIKIDGGWKVYRHAPLSAGFDMQITTDE